MSESIADISFEELPVHHEIYPRTEEVICRFGKKILWSGREFNKKTLIIAEGTPLPAKFPFCGGQFILVVDNDLSVSFNGKKMAESLITRIPVDIDVEPSVVDSLDPRGLPGPSRATSVSCLSGSVVFEDSIYTGSPMDLTSSSLPGPSGHGLPDLASSAQAGTSGSAARSETTTPLFVFVDSGDVDMFSNDVNGSRPENRNDTLGMDSSCNILTKTF
jgi:hypothetical protein